MTNTILIADDEPWQRMWLSHVLHTAGFSCSAVMDGADVLEQAQALNPALIIMDVEMPGVNGVEAAEHLRREPSTQHLPILFITSHASNPAGRLALGQTDWIRKPFLPADLLARVQHMLCES
jgi:CheY-like chemotaxis protein